MSIDFKMWHSIFDIFNNSVAHDKESFKKDYNRFVLKQDKLSILAEKAHYYSHLDFVNDGKIKDTFGSVRKRLNVPYEEDSDSNDFDFGLSK